ncbi:hypothetical protein BGZ99_001296 [Dissophora globulifera]|uniref:CCHC-type domain-containing protein n=1 Tax=Dissophora globulifera TaxID=979702 RepID=A0A9P6QZ52_9FUNG|nr:hypothetical protein BGZ99_001296 [Dissophora globulifera]
MLPPDNSMEDVDCSPIVDSQLPSGTSTVEASTETQFQSQPDPDFTMIERRRRYFLMIPTAAVSSNPKAGLRFLTEKIKASLAKTTIMFGQPIIRNFPQEGEDHEQRVIFEVASKDQMTAAFRAGFTTVDEAGKTDRTYFREYTEAAQTTQKEREVMLQHLAWNTTTNEIHAAMSQWGAVERVSAGFNKKKTMANATVTFAEASSVKLMIQENITYVAIGQDSAAVAQLGTKVIPIHRHLTKKLANLPEWFTPLDVLRLFEEISEDGPPIQSISMPVNPFTKRRRPEAYVYFESLPKWKAVENRVFTIGTKHTAWANPEKLTCRTCGSPDHLQKDCETLIRRRHITAIRRANSNAMNPAARPAGTAKPTVSARPALTGYRDALINKQINAKASTSTTKPTTSTTSASAKNHTTGTAQPAASAAKAITGPTPWQQAHEAIRQQVTALSNRVDTQLKAWQEQCRRINERMELMEQKIDNLPRLISQIFAPTQQTQSPTPPETEDSSMETEYLDSHTYSPIGNLGNVVNLGNIVYETPTPEQGMTRSPIVESTPAATHNTTETSTINKRVHSEMNHISTSDKTTNLRMKMNPEQAIGKLQLELGEAQARAASAEEQCRRLTAALEKSVQVGDQHLAPDLGGEEQSPEEEEYDTSDSDV